MTEQIIEQGQMAAADTSFASSEVNSALDAMLAAVEQEENGVEIETQEAQEQAEPEAEIPMVSLNWVWLLSWCKPWPIWATPSLQLFSCKPFLWQ